MNSTAGTHSKSLTESASIVGSCAIESRAPFMVTSIPGRTDPSEPFLPSRSSIRVPKSRDSNRLALVRTVHLKSAEPHAVRAVMVLPSTETTFALRKSTSPLLAICISSGRRCLPAAVLAASTPSCASAVCGGKENKKIKSEKAKNADPTTTERDLYRFKSIKSMSLLYKGCYEAPMRFMKNGLLYPKRVGGAADLEVEMRAGGFAGAADRADGRALRHASPCRYIQLARVAVERLRAVVMLDNKVIAVAAVPSAAAFGDDDGARGGREYAGAAWCADVDAVVAVQALRDNPAVNRPCIVIAE